MSKQIIIGVSKIYYEITDQKTQEKRSGTSLTFHLLADNLPNTASSASSGCASLTRKMDYNVFYQCTGHEIKTADDLKALRGREVFFNTESKTDSNGKPYEKVTGVYLLPLDKSFNLAEFVLKTL